jgi:hypothetical protein
VLEHYGADRWAGCHPPVGENRRIEHDRISQPRS